jgi:hypothetical protein
MIRNTDLIINFVDVDESINKRTVPLQIKFGDFILTEIPINLKIQKNKDYKFILFSQTPIFIPNTIIKYRVIQDGIYLSPIFSVLLDPSCVKGKTVKSKKGKMSVINKLASNLSSKGIIVTAIYPENIMENQQFIHGYIYQNNIENSETWVKATFPYPKVVYNQISSRRWENLDVSQNAKRILINKMGKRFFNTCFLDKYKSYNLLTNDPKLNKYLLDICEYTHSNLQAMIQKYNILYLKPIKNSLGNGIWRYSKLKDGRFVFQIKKNDKIISYTSKNVNKLIDFFDNSIGNQKYLVQQGIHLLKYENRIFDIRALSQKNNKGHWSLTGAGARVAAPNAYMTHVPNGGEIMNLEMLLDSTIENKKYKDKLQAQLQVMATIIPKTVESELGMSFGEMSMDIGINNDFQLYLIEVNAKPMRFDEIDIQHKSVNKLSQYISYLCNWD